MVGVVAAISVAVTSIGKDLDRLRGRVHAVLYRREIDEAMRPVSVILSQWGFHDIEGSVAVIGQPFPEHDPVLVVRFEPMPAMKKLFGPG